MFGPGSNPEISNTVFSHYFGEQCQPEAGPPLAETVICEQDEGVLCVVSRVVGMGLGFVLSPSQLIPAPCFYPFTFYC